MHLLILLLCLTAADFGGPGPGPFLDWPPVSLAAAAADTAPPINPPAPVLLAPIERHQTQATIVFQLSAMPEAFQVIRRVGGKTEKATYKAAVLLKHGRVAATGLHSFWWVDKQLNPAVDYTYTVVAYYESGASLESNAVETKP